MSRNGSGTYSLPAGNPVTTGTTISSTTHNNTLSDIATALSESLAKDGQTTPTANLPMGGYAHTGVGDATARTQYAKVSQIQDGGYVTLSSVSGTDTITATCAPAITAYAAGQFFTFVSAGANTGAVTLNINSLGAKAVTKEGTTALAAGDIASGAVVCVEYDGTRFQLVGGRSVQPLDADLTAIAALTTQAYGRSLLEVANEAALKALVNLEIGTDVLAYVAPGTSGNVLTSNGSAWTSATPQYLTSGTAQASTSGTSIDFTGIPAGTKRITISLSGVSTSGTSNPLIQIGDSGGVETTNYLGSSCSVQNGGSTVGANYTTGFGISAGLAANLAGGTIVLTLIDAASFLWAASGVVGYSNGAYNVMVGGSKALNAELDRVRITTVNGTDTFDAGTINILYE